MLGKLPALHQHLQQQFPGLQELVFVLPVLVDPVATPEDPEEPEPVVAGELQSQQLSVRTLL